VAFGHGHCRLLLILSHPVYDQTENGIRPGQSDSGNGIPKWEWDSARVVGFGKRDLARTVEFGKRDSENSRSPSFVKIIYVCVLQLQLQSFKPINTLPDLHMGTGAAASAQYSIFFMCTQVLDN